MTGMWKKRLSAFLLTLALTASLIPAAAAEEHHYASAWSSDGSYHWHVCTDQDCDARGDYESHDFGATVTTKSPTCFQPGEGYQECAVCKYKKTVSIPATNAHKAASGWTWDTAKHWHACTATSGCPQHLSEASHTFTSGEYSNNSSFHWQICTICGGTSAKAAHTDANGDGVCDVCHRGGMPVTNRITVTFMNGSSTYRTQTITKGSTPSNPGTPSKSESGKTYSFVGWSTSNPGSSAIYDGQSYKSSSQVASTALSANTTYYALYNVRSNNTITYSIKAGKSVSFDRSDFRDVYENEFSSGSLRWVEFETDDTLSTSRGTIYYDYGGSDEQAFSRSSLEDERFYYSSGDGDYDLNNLSFVAGDESRTVTLDFRACYSNSKYAEGTLIIEVEGGSSSSHTITYKVDTDDVVEFDRRDFNNVFQQEYSNYTVKYITFETDDTLSSSRGTVYYDYKGSDEKSFSASSLEDERFYYSSSDGDYDLNSLSFVSGSSERTVTLDFRAYYSSSRYVDGTVKILVGDSADDSDITYEVDPGKKVSFDRDDFNDFFQKKYKDYDIRFVTFETDDTLSSSKSGLVYFDYDGKDKKSFSDSTIDDYKFYYKDRDYGKYALDKLSFVAGDNFDKAVTLHFTAYYSDSRSVEGDLVIRPTGSGTSQKTGDITYQVDKNGEAAFDRDDFSDFFDDKYDGNYELRYVTFETDDTLSSSKSGLIYFDYDGKDKKSFSDSTIDDYEFYYKDSDYGKYALDKLSFVAGDNFDKAVKLHFTAYYSSSRHVEGTLVINPSGTSETGDSQGDIRYYATYTTNVQINANDIARFFSKKYPTSTLQYVTLKDVPSTGSLYYNYYGVSKYGASKLKLTSSNCGNYNLYFSPSSTSQYALTELTYLPSGTNYCAQIPFTAYGSGSKSLSGTILISVNLSAVSEVYGVTPKGTAVTFPASAMYIAVSSASGQGLSSIQLLELPDSSVGTIYVGTGTSTKANTSTRYGYSSGSQRMGQLRFVPASGFTGSVEIPYVACNSSGTPIAAGKFSLGVVSNVKKFSDMTSSTWCYKYVVELSDAGVIDGYTDGSFKPNNTVTYGAALKLIMLAAGYPEQKPTDSNPFSGYLAKARSEGIITRSNVNLSAPITRLQVAQIAAGALKLDTTNLSSVQPFTDTTDPSVQALNAAGIVEGYFSGGKSTYKPNNTLTRGQVSAIVWRMEQLAD